MKPKIVVIGSANTDMQVRVNSLPIPGQTVLGKDFAISQGGKGANQAVAAARLGAMVTFVVHLGRDAFGQGSAAAYRKEGLDLGYLAWDDEAPSGVALILVDGSGENIIAVASGANARLSPRDVEAAEPAICAADCILMQLEIPLECVEAAVKLAEKHGKRIVLNPAPATRLPPRLLHKVDVLTPNETELAALSGVAPGTSCPCDKLAESFCKEHRIENLVVTLGAKGALIFTGGQMKSIPAFPVHAVDTTGAGDAFNGGLVVALARGDDLEGAVRFANAAGALAASAVGAQPSLPRLAEVERLLRSGALSSF